MSTPIADLVEEMMARGCAPDLIVMAVRAAELASGKSGGIPVDTAAEKRRAYDRARKAEKRNSTGLSTGIPPEQKTALLISKKEKKIKERGTRIPPDWNATESDSEFATSKGMTQQRVETEVEKFRNYWTAKSGNAATKLDWSATWRNWVLSSLERVPGIPVSTTGPPTASSDDRFYQEKGFKDRDDYLRKTNGQADRSQVRGNPGASQNGAGHAPELQLSGGVARVDAERQAQGRAPDH